MSQLEEYLFRVEFHKALLEEITKTTSFSCVHNLTSSFKDEGIYISQEGRFEYVNLFIDDNGIVVINFGRVGRANRPSKNIPLMEPDSMEQIIAAIKEHMLF
jgi:hypothetical protein